MGSGGNLVITRPAFLPNFRSWAMMLRIKSEGGAELAVLMFSPLSAVIFCWVFRWVGAHTLVGRILVEWFWQGGSLGPSGGILAQYSWPNVRVSRVTLSVAKGLEEVGLSHPRQILRLRLRMTLL